MSCKVLMLNEMLAFLLLLFICQCLYSDVANANTETISLSGLNICMTDHDPDKANLLIAACLAVTVPTAVCILILSLFFFCCTWILVHQRRKMKQALSALAAATQHNDNQASTEYSQEVLNVVVSEDPMVETRNPATIRRKVSFHSYEDISLKPKQKAPSSEGPDGSNHLDLPVPATSGSNYHELEEVRRPLSEKVGEFHTYETVSSRSERSSWSSSSTAKIDTSAVSHQKRPGALPVSDKGIESPYNVLDHSTPATPRGVTTPAPKTCLVKSRGHGMLQPQKPLPMSKSLEGIACSNVEDYRSLANVRTFNQDVEQGKKSRGDRHDYFALEEPCHKVNKTNSTLSAEAEINESLRVLHSSFQDLFNSCSHFTATPKTTGTQHPLAIRDKPTLQCKNPLFPLVRSTTPGKKNVSASTEDLDYDVLESQPTTKKKATSGSTGCVGKHSARQSSFPSNPSCNADVSVNNEYDAIDSSHTVKKKVLDSAAVNSFVPSCSSDVKRISTSNVDTDYDVLDSPRTVTKKVLYKRLANQSNSSGNPPASRHTLYQNPSASDTDTDYDVLDHDLPRITKKKVSENANGKRSGNQLVFSENSTVLSHKENSSTGNVDLDYDVLDSPPVKKKASNRYADNACVTEQSAKYSVSPSVSSHSAHTKTNLSANNNEDLDYDVLESPKKKGADSVFTGHERNKLAETQKQRTFSGNRHLSSKGSVESSSQAKPLRDCEESRLFDDPKYSIHLANKGMRRKPVEVLV